MPQDVASDRKRIVRESWWRHAKACPPYPADMNGKQVISKLETAGWRLIRTSGSHYILEKEKLRVTVPMHGAKDIKPGTLASIQRQSGVKMK
ncbi:MAG: type II toxin-antitoxin system HicA family toxin [Sulfuricellaceae bacterium]